jgi:hypothetical protein
MEKFRKPINSNAMCHYKNPLEEIRRLLWGPKFQCRPNISPRPILLFGPHEFNSRPNAPRYTELDQNTITLHIFVQCPRIKRARNDFSKFLQ